MLSFLFEQYGYYPNLIDDMFVIDGWEFRIVEVGCDEGFLKSLEEYINIIRKEFNGMGVYILKNRCNKKISYYDNKKYVLMSSYKSSVIVSDLNKMHLLFNDKYKKVDLKELLSLWQSRMEKSETEGVSSLRIDGMYYSSNLEVSMFALGLCQNAIQYLSELIDDYGSLVGDVTVTHRRLKNLNSFDFFDPFNFIIDHPIRDYVELYKNNAVEFLDLVSILEFYRMDTKIATLFMARLMYPSEILDALEENVDKKDKSFKINYSIEKEVLKIKKAYLYFKKKYNIRPIYWLELN